MMIDLLLKNPAVKRALEAGEDRVGRLVTQILSNERVMQGVHTFVASAVNAKSTFDRGVKTAMQAVSLPTSEELEELRSRLSELEATLDGLASRLDRAGPKGDGGSGGAAG